MDCKRPYKYCTLKQIGILFCILLLSSCTWVKDEAEKAKSAGFSPQGGLEKEDYSQMTTREILEHTYKELEG